MRGVVAGAYALALLAPLYVFFSQRGGLGFLSGSDLSQSLQQIFPLFGLYAFTLVTMQILIATNAWWLRQVWPGIIIYHRYQGVFALLFALTHPFLILLGFGVVKYLKLQYVAPELHVYLIPSYTALIILVATVGSAFLAWRARRVPNWFKIHRFNYAVFPLIWVHSWFIGSDVSTTALKYVWALYLALVLVSVTAKYWGKLTRSGLKSA